MILRPMLKIAFAAAILFALLLLGALLDDEGLLPRVDRQFADHAPEAVDGVRDGARVIKEWVDGIGEAPPNADSPFVGGHTDNVPVDAPATGSRAI